ncbi:MAG TPA: hypothetical protein VFS14_02970 [Candidatus Saccharimonadales bacterium]|nr:hypothetical protein [Candidatus Saccharimonadales bacterium]
MTLQKRILIIVLITALLLAVPLTMMVLKVDGWNWSPGDFLIMGVLLLSTGFAIDFAVHKIKKPAYRILAVIAIVAVLLLIWVELAVDAVSKFIRLVLG